MNLQRLLETCRQALEASVESVRSRPVTAASRAAQIQALSLLRTLDQWKVREPYPEQPPRLARIVRELAEEVLGPQDPRVVGLRASATTDDLVAAVDPGASGAAFVVCLACRRRDDGGRTTCAECGRELRSFGTASLVDGRYLPVRELGRGAMGVVQEALDVHLERAVALKLLATEGPLSGAALTSLRREATALAAIRNDHVVQVYTFGPHAGGYFVAMELVVGRDLEAILEEHAAHRSTLPTPLAVTILSRVAAGLSAVHAAGLLHRDVKPSNVVIEDGTGRAVLVDFGLALRPAHSGPSGENDGAGTPLYLAPELIGVARAAPGRWNAADIYALGCTAFEMLTGGPPFGGEVGAMLERRRTEPPPRVSSRRPGLEPFDAPLLRALAIDPGARQADALELATELEAALQRWLTPDPTLPRAASADDPDPSPVRVAQTEGYPEGARILIVDDDAVFLKLATRCAELAFFQCPVTIESTTSSLGAITAVAKAMPDLVVLDYGLPVEDGVATLTRLRQMHGGDRPRVVVVSASVSEVEEWRFRALGVKDFVSKPIRFQAFVELLADIASRAGWQNALMGPRAPVA